MSSFARATTPTLHLMVNCSAIDWTEAENVYVTLKGDGINLTLESESLEVEANVIKVWLTQAQTLEIPEGSVIKVQVNWTYYVNGVLKRGATKPGRCSVTEQLLNEVIE